MRTTSPTAAAFCSSCACNLFGGARPSCSAGAASSCDRDDDRLVALVGHDHAAALLSAAELGLRLRRADDRLARRRRLALRAWSACGAAPREPLAARLPDRSAWPEPPELQGRRVRPLLQAPRGRPLRQVPLSGRDRFLDVRHGRRCLFGDLRLGSGFVCASASARARRQAPLRPRRQAPRLPRAPRQAPLRPPRPAPDCDGLLDCLGLDRTLDRGLFGCGLVGHGLASATGSATSARTGLSPRLLGRGRLFAFFGFFSSVISVWLLPRSRFSRSGSSGCARSRASSSLRRVVSSSAPVADWKRRLKSSFRESMSRCTSWSLSSSWSSLAFKDVTLPSHELRPDRQLLTRERRAPPWRAPRARRPART